VGDDWKPKPFSTWAPMALAGIGKLPGTLEDRSIVVRMKRKPRTRLVERLTRRNKTARTQAEQLAQKLARFATDNLPALKDAAPVPANLASDRAEDNWEPLLAIADAAGGEWPERSRTAARSLSDNASALDDDLGIRLLSDIRSIFNRYALDRIPSATLCNSLAEIEDGPWSEFGRSRRPITQIQLGRLLDPFLIVPGMIRLAGSTARGYYRKQFDESFSAYLPHIPILKRHNDTTQRAV
jgi:hypothetical protein